MRFVWTQKQTVAFENIVGSYPLPDLGFIFCDAYTNQEMIRAIPVSSPSRHSPAVYFQ